MVDKQVVSREGNQAERIAKEALRDKSFTAVVLAIANGNVKEEYGNLATTKKFVRDTLGRDSTSSSTTETTIAGCGINLTLPELVRVVATTLKNRGEISAEDIELLTKLAISREALQRLDDFRNALISNDYTSRFGPLSTTRRFVSEVIGSDSIRSTIETTIAQEINSLGLTNELILKIALALFREQKILTSEEFQFNSELSREVTSFRLYAIVVELITNPQNVLSIYGNVRVERRRAGAILGRKDINGSFQIALDRLSDVTDSYEQIIILIDWFQAEGVLLPEEATLLIDRAREASRCFTLAKLRDTLGNKNVIEAFGTLSTTVKEIREALGEDSSSSSPTNITIAQRQNLFTQEQLLTAVVEILRKRNLLSSEAVSASRGETTSMRVLPQEFVALLSSQEFVKAEKMVEAKLSSLSESDRSTGELMKASLERRKVAFFRFEQLGLLDENFSATTAVNVEKNIAEFDESSELGLASKSLVRGIVSDVKLVTAEAEIDRSVSQNSNDIKGLDQIRLSLRAADPIIGQRVEKRVRTLISGLESAAVIAEIVSNPLSSDQSRALERIEQIGANDGTGLISIRDEGDIELRKQLRTRLKELQRCNARVEVLSQLPRLENPVALKDFILALPIDEEADTRLQSELFANCREYFALQREARPEAYRVFFSEELKAEEEKLQQLVAERTYPLINLGENKAAFYAMRQRFCSNLLPLIESAKSSRILAGRIRDRLKPSDDAISFRSRLRINRARLEQQRPLTQIEIAYADSVEALSAFNPNIVAVAQADIELTSNYLFHHFEMVSRETQEELKDGFYMPLLQIGTGPNGLAGLAEIARLSPSLADQLLVIDEGEQPGGPFAVPLGPAWNLNSARSGREGILIANTSEDEEKTVRAYGNPGIDQSYPGERIEREGTPPERGSINRTSGYGLTVDNISDRRYPTNDQLQIALALQLATTAKKISLRTRLVKVSPNQEGRGAHRVTIEITDSRTNEKRLVTGTVDGVINTSGLGVPSYGFNPEGKRAQRVIQESDAQKDGVPKVSTTLRAFKGLASRYELEPGKGLGETLVIYGKGDSFKVIAEYLAGFFVAMGVEEVRKRFSKIYVIAKDAPRDARAFVDQQRPRYIGIADVIDRANREGLISFVDDRVGDFDYVDQAVSYKDRKVQLFNDSGEVITYKNQIIQADNVISTAGFRSQIETVYGDYLNGQSFAQASEPLTLPTNTAVSVGDTIRGVDSILFTGTAANPAFDEEKLDQLPAGARSALTGVGAENAVAIGFRAPDAQAAVREYVRRMGKVNTTIDQGTVDPLGFQKLVLPNNTSEPSGRLRLPFGAEREVAPQPTQSFTIPYSPDIRKGKIPRNAGPELIEDSFIAFISEHLAKIRFVDRLSKPVSGSISLEITKRRIASGDEQLVLVVKSGSTQDLSSGYLFVIDEIFRKDEFLVAYANEILDKSRSRNPQIDITLQIKSGSINPSKTELRA